MVSFVWLRDMILIGSCSVWILQYGPCPWKRSKTCIFVLEQRRKIQNLQTKQRKKENVNIVILHRKLPEKAKRLKFYWDFKDGWRRRTFSKRVLYYREHLETFDSETETGITESQEAIDEFYQPTEKCKHKQEKGYWYEHSSPLHWS